MNVWKKVLATATAATGAGMLALAAGIRETSRFVVHEVEVPVLKPGSLDPYATGVRLLHISDLHMLPGQELKQQWVRSLAALDPDVVINTGDNLGDKASVPLVLQALDPLLSRPGVFVFGTNDYYAPRPVNPTGYLTGTKRPVSDVELPWRGMRAAFIERGWNDATHRRVEFSAGGINFAFAGVDDPHHDLDDYSAIAGAPNPDADVAIGLTHSPEPRIVEAFAADGYDLVLAGHTHGGQLCLPGGKALVTNCGIDRERAKGLSRWGQMWMHVSNGVGTSKYAPVRTFCRPSATLLILTERPEH